MTRDSKSTGIQPGLQLIGIIQVLELILLFQIFLKQKCVSCCLAITSFSYSIPGMSHTCLVQVGNGIELEAVGSPVRTLPVAPLRCDLPVGFFANRRGNKAVANLRPTGILQLFEKSSLVNHMNYLRGAFAFIEHLHRRLDGLGSAAGWRALSVTELKLLAGARHEGGGLRRRIFLLRLIKLLLF